MDFLFDVFVDSNQLNQPPLVLVASQLARGTNVCNECAMQLALLRFFQAAAMATVRGRALGRVPTLVPQMAQAV